jgi:hypothetical protein
LQYQDESSTLPIGDEKDSKNPPIGHHDQKTSPFSFAKTLEYETPEDSSSDFATQEDFDVVTQASLGQWSEVGDTSNIGKDLLSIFFCT